MSKLLDGKVALVTGAGRGIGREHALMLAENGAKVVVNDLGGDEFGGGADTTPAQDVVGAIEEMGGEAVINGGNVAEFDEAKAMIDQAIDTYGDINIVINNAGILRDRMVFSLSEDDWDAVIGVHLKGTFGPSHHAATYWRNKAKSGEETYGRIINTSSPSGIYGNVGQTNYGAAKAAIAAFTIIAAQELVRYGVTVNCLAPTAWSRLTAPLMGGDDAPDSLKEKISPALDRGHRDLAGQPRGGQGHRAGLRHPGQPARHRRGLAPGTGRDPARRPGRARPGRRRADGQGPPQRQHGRPGPRGSRLPEPHDLSPRPILERLSPNNQAGPLRNGSWRRLVRS